MKERLISTESDMQAIKLTAQALNNKEFKFAKKHKALLITSINTYNKKQKLMLLAIELRKGWEEFGGSSMKNFLTKNFENKYSTLNRQLVAARVAYRIGGVNTVDKFSDDSLFQMNKLSKAKCKKVIKYIEEKCGDNYTSKSVTKKSVAEAMLALRLKSSPTTTQEPRAKSLKKILCTFEYSKKDVTTLAKILKSNLDKKFITKLTKTLQAQ